MLTQVCHLLPLLRPQLQTVLQGIEKFAQQSVPCQLCLSAAAFEQDCMQSIEEDGIHSVPCQLCLQAAVPMCSAKDGAMLAACNRKSMFPHCSTVCALPAVLACCCAYVQQATQSLRDVNELQWTNTQALQSENSSCLHIHILLQEHCHLQHTSKKSH